MDNVKRLFGDDDPRCDSLIEALSDVIYERGKGMLISTIIGCIELTKLALIEEQKD